MLQIGGFSETGSRKRQKPDCASAPSPGRSAELSSHESRDRTTEGFGLRAAFRLRQHPDDRFRAGGSHEHATAVAELGVQPRNLLFDRGAEVPMLIDGDILLRLRK